MPSQLQAKEEREREQEERSSEGWQAQRASLPVRKRRKEEKESTKEEKKWEEDWEKKEKGERERGPDQ